MEPAQQHRVRFTHPRYTIRSKFFRLFGGAFHIYDDRGNLVLYSDQKRFRLKEDIRLYDDEDKRTELLRISTHSVFDISGAYDVHDVLAGERVGTLKRQGITSAFLRDQWTLHDASGREIGMIVEDSAVKALLRRYVDVVSVLLPQRYHVEVGGRTVAVFSQRFNPIILKLDVDFGGDSQGVLDRRLALAAGVLFSAIEGRQD
ncbi:MAG TPA: hypothetical protein VF210_10145 [Pseudomonadales bacterium]